MRLIYTFASMKELNLQSAFIQKIDTSNSKNAVEASILRLDVLDTFISGNKWFKLHFFLKKAVECKAKNIASFGGYFSNHIVATAYACLQQNLNCILYVRGEEPLQYSPTLQKVKDFGATLIFLNRANYANKKQTSGLIDDTYFIPEGGNGELGVKGAGLIYTTYNLELYDYILAACGTGTTIAGILNKASSKQKIIGLNILKGYENLEQEIIAFAKNDNKNFILLNNYHFGGYAKFNQTIIDYMNNFYKINKIPTDFVYTGKLCYAFENLLANNYFKPNSKVLLIHSGGLQGNLGLKNGLLTF